MFWNVTPSQAAATAQAGPTAYKDGLKWAYKRRPRAWWASRGLSGSMERDLRDACVAAAAARGVSGLQGGGGGVVEYQAWRRRYRAINDNNNEIELKCKLSRVCKHCLGGVDAVFTPIAGRSAELLTSANERRRWTDRQARGRAATWPCLRQEPASPTKTIARSEAAKSSLMWLIRGIRETRPTPAHRCPLHHSLAAGPLES